jgi:hypothetical protein
MTQEIKSGLERVMNDIPWNADYELLKAAYDGIGELEAALEEAQQQLRTAKQTESIRFSSALMVVEECKQLRRELAETQQTIVWQREALESARNTMEDALSVGEARYKDFDTHLCPWADLSDGVYSIEASLGNKEEACCTNPIVQTINNNLVTNTTVCINCGRLYREGGDKARN